MPVIQILGIPQCPPGNPNYTEAKWQRALDHLAQTIKNTVAGLPILGIPASEVFVFFPADLLQGGLGETLIATVSGLFEKPERTAEVLKSLTDAITEVLGEFAEKHLTRCGTVEAYIISALDPAALSLIEIPRTK